MSTRSKTKRSLLKKVNETLKLQETPKRKKMVGQGKGKKKRIPPTAKPKAQPDTQSSKVLSEVPSKMNPTVISSTTPTKTPTKEESDEKVLMMQGMKQKTEVDQSETLDQSMQSISTKIPVWDPLGFIPAVVNGTCNKCSMINCIVSKARLCQTCTVNS